MVPSYVILLSVTSSKASMQMQRAHVQQPLSDELHQHRVVMLEGVNSITLPTQASGSDPYTLRIITERRMHRTFLWERSVILANRSPKHRIIKILKPNPNPLQSQWILHI